MTKTLTLIEPFIDVEYHRGFVALASGLPYVQRIGVSDHEWPIDCYSPTEKTVDDILYFSSLLEKDDVVLVHCFAGKSRSTAAALIILYDKYRDVVAARDELLRVRPQAAPNRLICSIADRKFGLKDVLARTAEELQPYPNLVYGSLYDVANELGVKNSKQKTHDGS